MADTGRRARGALWWAKLLVLILAALAIGWVAVKVAAVRAFPLRSGIPQRFDPNHPDAVFREAAEALLGNRGRLPAEYYPRIAEAAKREPLSAEPYMFFAMQALEQQDLARAERLLVEARRRDPRLRLARLALLGVYLQTNRVAEASEEIAVIVRLVPRAEQLLVPELARLAASPATADAVVAAVGDDPLMAAVIVRLAQQNVDPEHLLRLAARQPSAAGSSPTSWQATLLDTMVRRGEVRRAHGIWRRLVGISGTAPLLYDPRFERRPGPPPFNWALSGSGAGVAEPAAGGALDVEYYGRASAPLASQLLALQPGRYRLAMRAEGSANGEGSRIEWNVACAGSGAVLAASPLREISYNPRDVAVEFTVPASGCEGQWLRLQGVAAEFPTTQAVKISELSLQRVGGGQ